MIAHSACPWPGPVPWDWCRDNGFLICLLQKCVYSGVAWQACYALCGAPLFRGNILSQILSPEALPPCVKYVEQCAVPGTCLRCCRLIYGDLNIKASLWYIRGSFKMFPEYVHCEKYEAIQYISFKVVHLCNYTLLPWLKRCWKHSWKPFCESLFSSFVAFVVISWISQTSHSFNTDFNRANR
jgi:hypothetical protein